jgi:hypothetical protein
MSDTPISNRVKGIGRSPSVETARAPNLSIVPNGPSEHVVYLTDLDPAWVALRRPDGGGIALARDRTVFPHAWMWTESRAYGGGAARWVKDPRHKDIEPEVSGHSARMQPSFPEGAS